MWLRKIYGNVIVVVVVVVAAAAAFSVMDLPVQHAFNDFRFFERELRTYAGDDPLSVWVR